MNGLAHRIWSRDPAVFGGTESSAAVRESVSSRLGWLDAPAAVQGDAGLVDQFVADVRGAGLTDVVLIGIGGSSLGAEVVRDTAPRQPASSHLTVLDSTDERAVRHVTESIHPGRTLFLVASKSGSTVEVKSLERHFWRIM